MREVQAVIWDFDGTLVDTRQKNFNVTRALVERIKGEPPTSLMRCAHCSATSAPSIGTGIGRTSIDRNLK